MPIFEIVRRHRDTTVLAVLVILSVSLMVVPAAVEVRARRRPRSNAVLYPFYSVKNYFDGLGSVRNENRELKRMVATLLHERERLVQFRDERERLRRLAEFKEEQFLNLVPSEVIGKNLDRYQTTIVIDKGSSDAIRERMPVLVVRGIRRPRLQGVSELVLGPADMQPEQPGELSRQTEPRRRCPRVDALLAFRAQAGERGR